MVKTSISLSVVINGSFSGKLFKTIPQDLLFGSKDVISFGNKIGTAYIDGNPLWEDDFKTKKCQFKLEVPTVDKGGNWFKTPESIFAALKERGWKQ